VNRAASEAALGFLRFPHHHAQEVDNVPHPLATGPTTEGMVVLRQEPVLVVRRWSHTTWVSDIQESAQTSADPLSYRGGNMCDSNYWSRLDSFEPLTITR
jgi:hypothetical protein